MVNRTRIVLERHASRLSDKEKFCLDAFMVNKDREKAFLYSRKGESTSTGDSLTSQISRWFTSDPVSAYLELNGQRVEDALSVRGDGEEESVFDKITGLLKDIADGDDKRIAIQAAKELGNLYQLKGKSKEEAASRKMYYLPLRCHECEAYKYVKEHVTDKIKINND